MTERVLPEFPARPFPPDTTLFLGIGAQKCGTSWLNAVLSCHPDCLIREGEMHYFDTMYDAQEIRQLNRRIRALRRAVDAMQPATGAAIAGPVGEIARLGRLLSVYTGDGTDHSRYFHYILEGFARHRVVGDITPSYGVLDRAGFSAMAQAAPDTRMIFVMRDPVDRLWSSAKQAYAQPGMSDDDLYRRCLLYAERVGGRSHDRKLARSRFETTLANIDACAPDRTLVLFYEALFCQSTLDRICAFLGISPITADFGTPVNAGRTLALADEDTGRFYALPRPTYDQVAARFGAALPARWQARIAAFG